MGPEGVTKREREKKKRMLKILDTNPAGLVGNGKELEVKDRVDENKPDIIGQTKTKPNTDVASILGDFNYKEIDWNTLDPAGSETRRGSRSYRL